MKKESCDGWIKCDPIYVRFDNLHTTYCIAWGCQYIYINICSKTVTKRNRMIKAKFRLIVALGGDRAERSYRRDTGVLKDTSSYWV